MENRSATNSEDRAVRAAVRKRTLGQSIQIAGHCLKKRETRCRLCYWAAYDQDIRLVPSHLDIFLQEFFNTYNYY